MSERQHPSQRSWHESLSTRLQVKSCNTTRCQVSIIVACITYIRSCRATDVKYLNMLHVSSDPSLKTSPAYSRGVSLYCLPSIQRSAVAGISLLSTGTLMSVHSEIADTNTQTTATLVTCSSSRVQLILTERGPHEDRYFTMCREHQPGKEMVHYQPLLSCS